MSEQNETTLEGTVEEEKKSPQKELAKIPEKMERLTLQGNNFTSAKHYINSLIDVGDEHIIQVKCADPTRALTDVIEYIFDNSLYLNNGGVFRTVNMSNKTDYSDTFIVAKYNEDTRTLSSIIIEQERNSYWIISNSIESMVGDSFFAPYMERFVLWRDSLVIKEGHEFSEVLYKACNKDATAAAKIVNIMKLNNLSIEDIVAERSRQANSNK